MSHLYNEALAQNLKLQLQEYGQPETSTLTPTFYVEVRIPPSAPNGSGVRSETFLMSRYPARER